MYDNAWLKARFLKAIAGGCSDATLTELVNILVSNILDNHVRPDAVTAIAEHRRAGHRLLLATASFDFYVQTLADQLGFDEVVCTRALRGPTGALIGDIDGANCYGKKKVDAVMGALPDRQGYDLTAYTDHHSDWELLLEADVPVAVSPTRELRRLANMKKIEIRKW